MPRTNFYRQIESELARIDSQKIDKRNEKIIDSFSDHPFPRAIISEKERAVFNSNDYLGLRFHPEVRKAEEFSSKKFGAGPGAVRFISGSLKIHKDLEKNIANFHSRESAVIFSSAFAVNIGVIHAMLKGQSRDSLISSDVLVISDQLNHRSIIDGIRVAGLEKPKKAIFDHMNPESLRDILKNAKGTVQRVIIVTDGIFSMLGEAQDLKTIESIKNEYDDAFEHGIFTIVDDSHGVACFGKTGRGCEEVSNSHCDLLIGTLGKGFGTDGGYVTGNKLLMDYLRESSATYIYSNPIAPGTAGAANKAVSIVNSPEGTQLLKQLNTNISTFKKTIVQLGFTFAADSSHPIQPILIGDPQKTRQLTDSLFENGILVTNINYPIVPKGADEIRVQLSATHTEDDLNDFFDAIKRSGKQLSLI